MFVIDWILAKFHYHKFYKMDDIFAELDKLDKIKPVAAKKRPASKVAVKKPLAKKAATARKKA